MRPGDRWWNRWRGMLLIALAALGWGLGLGSHSLRATGDLDPTVVLKACHDEVRNRMPPRDVTRFLPDPRVRARGDGVEVVWSFEGPGGRTQFSCEAVEEQGRWTVTQILAVNWTSLRRLEP